MKICSGSLKRRQTTPKSVTISAPAISTSCKLGQLCPTFDRKMLLGNFKENQGTTTVTDISGYTMAKILQYLYTGQVKKCDIDVKLLLAADKYEMEHLHAVCELEIGTKMTIELLPR